MLESLSYIFIKQTEGSQLLANFKHLVRIIYLFAFPFLQRVITENPNTACYLEFPVSTQPVSLAEKTLSTTTTTSTTTSTTMTENIQNKTGGFIITPNFSYRIAESFFVLLLIH